MTLRKLLTVVLAIGFPLVSGCRLVCAAGMEVGRAAAAVRPAGACHHSAPSDRGDKRAPCCMTEDGGASALLPASVDPASAPAVFVAVLPSPADLLPAPSSVLVGWSRPPPDVLTPFLLPSSQGPRAPPSPASAR